LLTNVADISVSEDLTNSFKQHVVQNHSDMNMTFSMMVLDTNFWPLSPPKDGFIVPTDIRLPYDRFQEHYQRMYSNRNLMWLWNYSKNELLTNYLNRKYILMTSAYQMAVLLQYNNNDTLLLDELATATNVGRDVLTQVLQPLVRSRVLISERDGQYDLNLRTSYFLLRLEHVFNRTLVDFESKKIRVNLNRPTKGEVKAESSDVLKTVGHDRKYINIQATIIRYALISGFYDIMGRQSETRVLHAES
jgi:cullin 1